MNVCNPLRFSIRKREGVGGTTQINILCGNIYLADCRKFVPIFAVLPSSGDMGQKPWDHGGEKPWDHGESWELWGCSEVMGLVAAGWHRGQSELVPLCVQGSAAAQSNRKELNLLGKTSPSRTTSSHRRTPSFPCLMSHQQWNIVIPSVDARVIHSNQPTFHWIVVNFAWFTLKIPALSLVKAFLCLIYSCPLCRSPWLLSQGCLGQSPGAGLMIPASATPLLTKPLCSQVYLAFVRIPEFYFTIKTIPSTIADLHHCCYKTNK